MGKGQRRRGRQPSATASTLGQQIRDRRIALGLTQAQLGAPIYQGGCLSDVEHGRVTPSLEALEHIAGRLGIAAAELLGQGAVPSRPSDALARAHRLVVEASAAATAAEAPLVAAAVVLDALRRELSRIESS